MTAILTFSLNHVPYLLGDALISGNERSPVKMPALRSDSTEVFPVGSGRVPVALLQKVCVVTDHLAIAWSGSPLIARAVLGDLRREAQTRTMTSEEIAPYLKNIILDYSVQGGTEVSFVGQLIEPQIDRKGTFSWNAKWNPIGTHPVFGDIRFAGSGGERLKDDLFRAGRMLPQTPKQDSFPMEAACLWAGLIASELLVPQSSLLLYFGGSYELALNTTQGFRKLDGVLLVFWQISRKSDGSLFVVFPRVLVRHSYSDGLLQIRRFLLEDDAGHYGEEQFIVPPILPSENDEGFRKSQETKLDSNHRVHVFVVIEEQPAKDETELLMIADLGPSSNLLSIDDGEGNVSVEVNTEALTQVIRRWQR